MNETNALTKAVAEWVSAKLPGLDEEQARIWNAMLAGYLDVAVEVRLRKGAITLRAIDEAQGRFTVLASEDVAPLRDWNQ